MRKSISILVVLITGIIVSSCIPDKKEKTQIPDLYDGYHGEQGFVIMNIPPVLFKMIGSENDSLENIFNKAFEDIHLIRLLLFDEGDKTILKKDLKEEIENRIKQSEFKVLTKVVSGNETMTLYAQGQEKNIVREVVIVMTDSTNLVCVDFLGEINIFKLIENADKMNMQQFLDISLD